MSENRFTEICDSFDTCALAGAAAFIGGIPKSHILVNGPLWCYYYAKGHLKRADNEILDRMTGSQPDNKAVIFGGEDFLKQEIRRLCQQEDFSPSMLFVENSCAFSLIGDDTVGILKELELPFPAVSMDCGGLVGGFAEGYQKAFIESLKVLRPECQDKLDKGVNLLGTSSFYLHGKADKDEMVRLLELAGYTVVAAPGNGTSWAKLKDIGRASLNIVVNEELGLKTARYLEKELGIPYVIAGLPYGLKGTKKWLEQIAAKFPGANMTEVDMQLANAHKKINEALEDYSSYWGNIWFDEVILSGNGSQILCMAEALRNEWLDTGKLTALCLTAVENNIYSEAVDEIVTLNKDMKEWRQYIPITGDVLLLGSNSEAMNVMRANYENITFQNIAYPIHDEIFIEDIPFVGITGAKNMVQALWNKYMQKMNNSRVK